jgi:hypothetical protein
MHKLESGMTLDLEQLCRTRGDPGAGSSWQAPPSPVDVANPRVRVLERPRLPSQIHRTISQWSPQTRQPLREGVRNLHAPSTIGAHAPTQLRRGA